MDIIPDWHIKTMELYFLMMWNMKNYFKSHFTENHYFETNIHLEKNVIKGAFLFMWKNYVINCKIIRKSKS